MHVFGFKVSDSQGMEAALGFLIACLLICFRKMIFEKRHDARILQEEERSFEDLKFYVKLLGEEILDLFHLFTLKRKELKFKGLGLKTLSKLSSEVFIQKSFVF
ncbi:hypothetical protein Avbf_16358 [Armadillidium vulgare]|nr:hypothetical protein Avbf_16358 [Armadillidium vulgare]